MVAIKALLTAMAAMSVVGVNAGPCSHSPRSSGTTTSTTPTSITPTSTTTPSTTPISTTTTPSTTSTSTTITPTTAPSITTTTTTTTTTTPSSTPTPVAPQLLCWDRYLLGNPSSNPLCGKTGTTGGTGASVIHVASEPEANASVEGCLNACVEWDGCAIVLFNPDGWCYFYDSTAAGDGEVTPWKFFVPGCCDVEQGTGQTKQKE